MAKVEADKETKEKMKAVQESKASAAREQAAKVVAKEAELKDDVTQKEREQAAQRLEKETRLKLAEASQSREIAAKEASMKIEHQAEAKKKDKNGEHKESVKINSEIKGTDEGLMRYKELNQEGRTNKEIVHEVAAYEQGSSGTGTKEISSRMEDATKEDNLGYNMHITSVNEDKLDKINPTSDGDSATAEYHDENASPVHHDSMEPEYGPNGEDVAVKLLDKPTLQSSESNSTEQSVTKSLVKTTSNDKPIDSQQVVEKINKLKQFIRQNKGKPSSKDEIITQFAKLGKSPAESLAIAKSLKGFLKRKKEKIELEKLAAEESKMHQLREENGKKLNELQEKEDKIKNLRAEEVAQIALREHEARDKAIKEEESAKIAEKIATDKIVAANQAKLKAITEEENAKFAEKLAVETEAKIKAIKEEQHAKVAEQQAVDKIGAAIAAKDQATREEENAKAAEANARALESKMAAAQHEAHMGVAESDWVKANARAALAESATVENEARLQSLQEQAAEKQLEQGSEVAELMRIKAIKEEEIARNQELKLQADALTRRPFNNVKAFTHLPSDGGMMTRDEMGIARANLLSAKMLEGAEMGNKLYKDTGVEAKNLTGMDSILTPESLSHLPKVEGAHASKVYTVKSRKKSEHIFGHIAFYGFIFG